MTPDGLMSSLHGPYKGPTADWNMWNDSGLEEQLKATLLPEGIHIPRYYLYGDLAYWPAFGIMGPFRPQNVQGILSREEKAANLAMSSVRITVEWGFGMNVNLWGINNYKRGSKVMSSPVAALYIASTLLTNIRTCMNGGNQVCLLLLQLSTLLTNIRTCMNGGNQVSEKFGLSPPSLEEYIQSIAG